MKILLSEDEPQLNHVLEAAMTAVGYQVTATFNGQEAYEKAKNESYDVMIFDIMMPIMDGITLVKKLRQAGDKTYIIMLTAKAEIDDRVTGFDSGADDYLTKPFSLKELMARLRSLERRSDEYAPKVLEKGNVKLDTEKQQLSSTNSISLSNKETDLLGVFLMNEGKEFTTQELFIRLWADEADASADEVWVYVSYLRSKLASVGADFEIVGEKGGSFKLVRKGS